MNRCLAFVLGGGGARGALQVGALRALIEAGFKPDLLVGTSIGAVNAAGLALWGVDLVGVDTLERVFGEVAQANLMDPRLGRLAVRALSGRPNHHATQRVANFLTSKGISPELRFGRLKGVRLGLIATDLETGQPVIYGQNPEQSVLEGVLASMALPPWFAPQQQNGHVLLDGAALSNLPIEPAMTMGATDIIALNVDDPRNMLGGHGPMDQYVSQMFAALDRRHMSLETQLAEARGVAVRRLDLQSREPTPIWDFDWCQEMIATGYETAVRQIEAWSSVRRHAWP